MGHESGAFPHRLVAAAADERILVIGVPERTRDQELPRIRVFLGACGGLSVARAGHTSR